MSGAQAGVHFHGTPAKLVEAAGQMLRSFRNGLDYAFILAREDAGRVIRAQSPNPSAGSPAVSQSMSLYRAERVGHSPPLGVTRSLRSDHRVHRMSPVIHFALAGKGDPCIPLP